MAESTGGQRRTRTFKTQLFGSVPTTPLTRQLMLLIWA